MRNKDEPQWSNRAVIRKDSIEVVDHAEGGPLWAGSPAKFESEWGLNGRRSVQDACAKLRTMAGESEGSRITQGSEFLVSPLRIMQTVVLHGFELRAEGGMKKLLAAAPWLPGETLLLSRDIAREWFLCDNAAAMWVKGGRRQSGAPAVTVLDTERILSYQNGYGGEKMKITLPQAEPEAGTPARWAKAMKDGTPLELNGTDEFFRVRCRAKRGKGLARPALELAMPLFGMLELLALADRSGAWEHRNLIQQWLIGHEIRYGPRAGSADHFIKPGMATSAKKKLKDKVGPITIFSNFDTAIKWNYLDTAYFKKEKYEGALMRLERWFGPVGRLLRDELKEADMPLVRAWIDEERATIGGLVEDIVNSPEYWDGAKGASRPRITAGFSPVTLLDRKGLLELVRFATAQGLASQQTGRELLGLNHGQEMARLKEEAKQDGNRPNFEQKQGLLTPGTGAEGGRPS